MLQYFEIPGIDQTIRKALVDGVAYRVMAEAGMNRREVKFSGDFDTNHQPGSTIGDQTGVEYPANTRVFCEITEERDEYSRINRQSGLNMELPFFQDKASQVYAVPGFVGYNVTLNFRRRSTSRDELLRWTNRLQALQDAGRYSLMLEAECYYNIPPLVIELLNACYVASETRVPKHESFKAYLADYFNREVISTSNVSGGQSTLSVRHTMTRLEVVYEVQGPEIQKEDGYQEAAFTVRFYYQRPEEVVVSYPYIINQTELPAKWWPDIDPPWVTNDQCVQISPMQKDRDDVANGAMARENLIIKLPYLMSPTEQFERLHCSWQAAVVPIFGTDVAFGPDNMVKPTVLSLQDLPYEWNADLRPYIEHCRRIDKTGMSGLFRMAIFEEGLQVDSKHYLWKDTVFTVQRDMDVTKGYYITESVVLDWSILDGWWPLNLYPKAVEWICKWLLPGLKTEDWWWDLDRIPNNIMEIIWKEGSTWGPRPPGDRDGYGGVGEGGNGGGSSGHRYRDRNYYLTVFNTSLFTIKGTENA